MGDKELLSNSGSVWLAGQGPISGCVKSKPGRKHASGRLNFGAPSPESYLRAGPGQSQGGQEKDQQSQSPLLLWKRLSLGG